MAISSHEIIIDAVLQEWPDHKFAIDRNLKACSAEEMDYSNRIASMIRDITGDNMSNLVSGYKWMCKMIEAEELHFRRTGLYRNRSFSEVLESVYNVPEIMTLYMDGLLVSQVLWSNHIRVGNYFESQFVNTAKPGRRHLEIGTGHGLMLALACVVEGEFSGWDISADSIKITEACLKRIGITRDVSLVRQDLFKSSSYETFDDIVISEVLEHIDNPHEAMKVVRDLLVPGGRVFINVPVNAPTIDHIYLFHSPEHVIDLVQRVGLEVEKMLSAPAAGYKEATARKLKAAISCAIIARKPQLTSCSN